VRVATNQVRALRERGHDAVLVAAASGFERLPTEYDGVPVRTFPAVRVVPGTGFAGIASPAMLRWVRASAGRFDLAHVHLARDLVTLLAARAWCSARKPFVTQTHGMLMPSRNPLAPLVDRLLTRRLVADASASFALTAAEEAGLRAQFPGTVSLERLVNGVPSTPAVRTDEQGDSLPEVLFLARLHARKRPLAFVRAAAVLAPRFPGVRFTLVGPDEGEGRGVADAVSRLPPEIRCRVAWEGALPPEETLARLGAADVYVLPSVDEPFPMSVLEAMSAGTPVVVTRTCGLAPAVAAARAGVVVEEDGNDLPVALGRLLEDAPLRAALGQNGRALVEQTFSVGSVAALLEEHYARIVTAGREVDLERRSGVTTTEGSGTGSSHRDRTDTARSRTAGNQTNLS
jgi:glycosyltransferase involved in cell wall biosynthesis